MAQTVSEGGGGKVAAKKAITETVVISPPNIKQVSFGIIGTAPYVQLKFSEKAKEQIRATQEAGARARKGTKKEPRNFENDYRQAMHTSFEGWCGIPASALRNALISACRIVGFQMTKAKLALFIVPDGVDGGDGTPLVKITGEPEMVIHHVRNEIGEGRPDGKKSAGMG